MQKKTNKNGRITGANIKYTSPSSPNTRSLGISLWYRIDGISNSSDLHLEQFLVIRSTIRGIMRVSSDDRLVHDVTT